MWEGAKSDLSSKPVFWQFISTLPGKLYAKIEKKLLKRFGANGLKSAKFDVSDLDQIYL